MPKPLILRLCDADFPLQLERVERSDLYGSIEIETLDERGRKCTLATLAADGRTIIGASGSALAMLTPDGHWVDRKDLRPVDNQGRPMTPVPSSYAAPVPLEKTATIDEYLSHNIRSVYQVSPDAAAAHDLAPLMAELGKGTIYQFPYSFRGGLEPDAAFLLLGSDGNPFIAIGTPTRLEMVGLQQAEGITDDDAESAEDDDVLDFSMM